MKVFGLSLAGAGDEVVETPVGRPCAYCDEPFGHRDVGLLVPLKEAGKPDAASAYHEACWPFVLSGDTTVPEGMTKRQAARAAWKRHHAAVRAANAPVASDS